MGRAAAGLLILLALAPSALGQTLHEDFSRADDDEAILRLSAARVLLRATEALDHALERRPDEAARAGADADALSLAMHQAARANASAAAASAGRLAPLASAARGLSENATLLAEDWAAWQNLTARGFTTRQDALQGELLLGSLRQGIEGGRDAADAYARLQFDTDPLREVLARFLREVEDLKVPEVEGEDAPALFLEVVPSEVTVTRPLLLRGVLQGDAPEGNRTVRLEADGAAWGEATTDARGFFSARRVADAALGVGAHVARARVASAQGDIVSNDANFTVVPLATRLVLSLPATRLHVNLTAPLSIRLLDEDGAPVAGRVAVALDGGAPVALELGASGGAVLPLDTGALGLGRHEAVAEFAGDALRAPARATLAFEVVAPPLPSTPAHAAGTLLGILVALLALHLVLLGLLARRHPRALVACAAAGPVVLLLVGAALRLPLPASAGLAGAALLAGLAVTSMRQRRLRAAAPAAVVPEAPAPLPAIVPARPAAADPLQDLLDLYASLLARLAAEGVDVRPLTHREVAGAMRARRYPEEPVRALTRALERALYAGVPPRAEDVAPVRAAFAAMGAGA